MSNLASESSEHTHEELVVEARRTLERSQQLFASSRRDEMRLLEANLQATLALYDLLLEQRRAPVERPAGEVRRRGRIEESPGRAPARTRAAGTIGRTGS